MRVRVSGVRSSFRLMASIGNITFDCADPRALSHFWSDLFGWPRAEWPPELREQLLAGGLTEQDLEDRSVAMDPDGVAPRMFFQRVPEGKTVKNRVHLDISVFGPARRPTADELDAEKDRLVALGATVDHLFEADWGGIPERHYVMHDPEGNEFCLQ
jgi:catechol 2,3-dioxygenase-like lactoylglutathione lyase family enzyme